MGSSLVLLVYVFSLTFINSEQVNYCDFVQNIPICTNKSHLLCNQTKTIPDGIPRTILVELNEFRSMLSKVQDICNLNSFTWNNELAQMAYATLGVKTKFCRVTPHFKNIIYYEDTIIRNNKIIYYKDHFKTKTNLISAINFPTNGTKNLSWIFSAFSNEIGCYIRKWDIRCMINGVALNYFDESFGRGIECANKRVPFNPFNECVNNLPDLVAVTKIGCTSSKFILMKLREDQQSIKWDYDLQYLAELMVAKKFILPDGCPHLYKFNEIVPLRLRGIRYFHEEISNIDMVWQSTNISYNSRIGCAIYISEEQSEEYFNIYCLHSIVAPISYINIFLRFIGFNKFDSWIVYGMIGLVYLTILAGIIFLYILKLYARKRLLFLCSDM